MYVVTFYSYQGGTGRTTALVNVAVDLALRGRKVLVVDFDLGKPALSDFRPLGLDSSRPGVVEFITEYLHLGQAPVLMEYVYQAKVDGGTGGEVWLMPAGRADDNYWKALARLDWQDFFAMRDGFLLMEDLKAQWRDVLQPDYVLIDAPAGITDLTSVCAQQLADDVVFVIVPDQSDLTGIERVMREVFTESIAEGPRRIDIHLVTSKVPDLDGEEVLPRRGLGSILEGETLDVEFDLAAELPYDSALLLERQIVVLRRPGSRLARQYRQLANALVLGNCTQDRDGAKAFLKELQLHPERAVGEVAEWLTEEQWRWFDNSRKLDQVIKRFTAKHDEAGRLLVDADTAMRDAEVLGQAASYLFLAGQRPRSAEVLDEALELCPTKPALLWQRASYRFQGQDSGFVDDLLTLLDLPSQDAQTLTPEELRHSWGMEIQEQRSQLPQLNTQPLDHDVLRLETVSEIDSYVVSAVRLLRRHAPERLEEALQRRRVRSLSESDRARLLSEQQPDSNFPDLPPKRLIQWKCFCEVIARLEPSVQGAAEPNVFSAFHLAMAHWAVGNEREATQVSQQALKPWLVAGPRRLRDLFGTSGHHMVLLQMFALLAFRANDLETANLLAIRLVGDLGEHHFQGTRFFSYWRYRAVTFDQFREDCRDLHQMIKQRRANATALLPPFLSKSLTGV